MTSERTNALLEHVVKPGEHKLEFHARWSTEIEMGTFADRNAARFWSRHDRQNLLRPFGMSMEEALEEWDENEHGERPEEGSPEWLEDDALQGEDGRFVYVNPELLLPEQGFFMDPLPAPAAEEHEEERRRIPLAELLPLTDLARFEVVTESQMYPDPAPSAWHYTTGWKGNHGECTVTVERAVALRELLRAWPLHAEVWVGGDGDYHFADVIVGDGEYVEWENGSGKSAEFELTPPDNVRLWRLAGNAIGRFMMLQRRASERVYAPGGMGMESVRREFEALAVASQVE